MLKHYITEPKIMRSSEGFYVGTEFVEFVDNDFVREPYERISAFYNTRSGAYGFLSQSGIVCDVCTEAHAFDDSGIDGKMLCFECSLKRLTGRSKVLK